MPRPTLSMAGSKENRTTSNSGSDTNDGGALTNPVVGGQHPRSLEDMFITALGGDLGTLAGAYGWDRAWQRERRTYPTKFSPKQAVQVEWRGSSFSGTSTSSPETKEKGTENNVQRGPQEPALTYMSIVDDEYANDAECMYDIGVLLKREVAACLVGIFEEDAPELCDFDHFMILLLR
uniref:Uncharacterized protein n=1 Tax=Sphaerodactylus townsendi TaxID=933632 RepID=A0ACB8G655_9SAUR